MVQAGQEFRSYWFVLHVLTRFFWSLRLTLIHFGTVCWNWCSFCRSISSSSWTEYRCYSTCVLWYQLDKSLTLIDLCYTQLRVSSGPSVLKLVLFLSFNFPIIVKSVIHVSPKCDQLLHWTVVVWLRNFWSVVARRISFPVLNVPTETWVRWSQIGERFVTEVTDSLKNLNSPLLYFL